MTLRTPVLLRAAEVAARVHAGQRRKGGDVPYRVHPRKGARPVAEDGRGEASVVAALLRDEMSAAFGPAVRDLVAALTGTPDVAARDRAARKRRQAAHVATAPEAARAIRLAHRSATLRDRVHLPNARASDDARADLHGTALVAVTPTTAGIPARSPQETRP